MKKSLIASVCLFIATVILASLTSYNASALDLTTDASFVQTWTNNRMVCAVRNGSNITFNSNTCVLNGGGSTGLIGTGLSYIYTADVNLVQGDYYEFLLQVGVSGGAQTDIPVVWNMTTTNNFTLVSFEKVSIDENLGSSATTEAYVSYYKVILRSSVNNSSYPLELGYSNHSANMFYIAGDTGSLTIDFRITSINRYSPNNYQESLRSIDSGVQTLNDTMSALNDNEGRVADVAEDEYNQTQEDREQASSDANGFAFNFSLPNPFSIFQVSDGCVSTPTIDSWLHLEGDWQSPHCPIIPANVRNTLTPIVTLIVSLASLMVVIRWVSSSNVGVSDDIGQGGYSNSLTAKVNADKIRRAK